MKEDEEEIIALAEQLNSRLDKTHDSVDLDNLFAFLTDVQTGRNPIIDQIGEKMRELVTDIDMEVRNFPRPFYVEMDTQYLIISYRKKCGEYPNKRISCTM